MKIFQIDAFTAEPFAGNPAAVCLAEGPLSETWMQQVAAEMNLSETAFVHPMETGFSLRWFTPAAEVPLCGHATLASAHVLWEFGAFHGEVIEFHGLSGALRARRRGERIEIDLPAMSLTEDSVPEAVEEALGVTSLWSGTTPDRGFEDRDRLIELACEAEVRQANPDFKSLGAATTGGVIITAPADSPEFDFVSRYFAPAWGIDEDPVTGSAHCALVPFWAARLDRPTLVGYQASQRGGTVHGRVAGGRVLLEGHAVTVLEGRLTATEAAHA